MSIHEWFEYIAEVILLKAVAHWAKKNPKTLDMRTHTFVNGKRYLIHIRRGDYKPDRGRK
jgi:hypothetical protein